MGEERLPGPPGVSIILDHGPWRINMIPEFNKDGNLPEGLYNVGEAEFFERFCSKYARRKWFGERFQEFLYLLNQPHNLIVFCLGKFC